MALADNPTGALVIRISYTLGAIDIIAVLLRLLARRKSNATFGADDFLGVLSLIPLFVMIGIGHAVVVKGGMGLHIVDVTDRQQATFLKLMMAGVVTYCITITIVKISILLLYRRIFSTAAFLTKSLWIGLLCITWFVVAIFTAIFWCHPFSASFKMDEFGSPDHCINIRNFFWATAGSNLAIDFIFLYLPLHEVWNLQLQKKQKLLLSGIFLMGGGVLIAGTIRLVTVSYFKASDMTLTATAQYTWSQVEPATAILCSSIVTYRPLLHKAILHPSKLYSRFFSHNAEKLNVSSSGGDEEENIDSEAYAKNNDLWRLNAKASEKGLHVVHVQLPPR